MFDACNWEGWLDLADVMPGEVPAERDPGLFEDSVFVIDAGHGYPDLGAVGPSGLSESEVNLDVATQIVGLLSSPQTVDWGSGTVSAGDSIPAAGAAVMTRSPAGPNGGDYELGLSFRAELANSVDATAMVSIHLNSPPSVSLDHPGSEAYVSMSTSQSARLGGLVVDELRKGLDRFEADWVGAPGTGVFSRVDPDGTDFYTVLGASDSPGAVIEGAYISNDSEEALALTADFRRAYAEGVYRALVRFVTTTEDPISPPEAEVWETSGPGRNMDDCQIPGS